MARECWGAGWKPRAPKGRFSAPRDLQEQAVPLQVPQSISRPARLVSEGPWPHLNLGSPLAKAETEGELQISRGPERAGPHLAEEAHGRGWRWGPQEASFTPVGAEVGGHTPAPRLCWVRTEQGCWPLSRAPSQGPSGWPAGWGPLSPCASSSASAPSQPWELGRAPPPPCPEGTRGWSGHTMRSVCSGGEHPCNLLSADPAFSPLCSRTGCSPWPLAHHF